MVPMQTLKVMCAYSWPARTWDAAQMVSSHVPDSPRGRMHLQLAKGCRAEYAALS